MWESKQIERFGVENVVVKLRKIADGVSVVVGIAISNGGKLQATGIKTAGLRVERPN